MFRDAFRAQLSAVYNANRLIEKPIPSIEQPNFENQRNQTGIDDTNTLHDESSFAENFHEMVNEETTNAEKQCAETGKVGDDLLVSDDVTDNFHEMVNNETTNEQNASETISEQSLAVDTVENEIITIVPMEPQLTENSEQNQADVNSSNGDGVNAIPNETGSELISAEAKNTFEPVQVESDDSSAFCNLFTDAAIAGVILCEGETAAVNEKGQIEITKTFDDGMVCKYIHGQVLIPKDPELTVKINDPVTANIPYRENVSFNLDKNSIFCDMK